MFSMLFHGLMECKHQQQRQGYTLPCNPLSCFAGLLVCGGTQGVARPGCHQGPEDHPSVQGGEAGAPQGDGFCHLRQHTSQVPVGWVAPSLQHPLFVYKEHTHLRYQNMHV